MKFIKIISLIILVLLIIVAFDTIKNNQILKVERAIEMLESCPFGAIIKVTASTPILGKGLTVSCSYHNHGHPIFQMGPKQDDKPDESLKA